MNVQYGKLVDLARQLEDLHSTMLQKVFSALDFRPNGESAYITSYDAGYTHAEMAHIVGVVEGSWQAFVDTVMRAAGSSLTPKTILSMEGEARRIAEEAFHKEYNRAFNAMAADPTTIPIKEED